MDRCNERTSLAAFSPRLAPRRNKTVYGGMNRDDAQLIPLQSYRLPLPDLHRSQGQAKAHPRPPPKGIHEPAPLSTTSGANHRPGLNLSGARSPTCPFHLRRGGREGSSAVRTSPLTQKQSSRCTGSFVECQQRKQVLEELSPFPSTPLLLLSCSNRRQGLPLALPIGFAASPERGCLSRTSLSKSA